MLLKAVSSYPLYREGEVISLKPEYLLGHRDLNIVVLAQERCLSPSPSSLVLLTWHQRHLGRLDPSQRRAETGCDQRLISARQAHDQCDGHALGRKAPLLRMRGTEDRLHLSIQRSKSMGQLRGSKAFVVNSVPIDSWGKGLGNS